MSASNDFNERAGCGKIIGLFAAEIALGASLLFVPAQLYKINPVLGIAATVGIIGAFIGGLFIMTNAAWDQGPKKPR